MKKAILKLKVPASHIEEVVRAYDQLMAEYRPENPHEQLLMECAVAFRHKMRVFAEKEQEKYTIPINGVEAIAFLQLWATQPIQVNPFGVVILNGIIGKIDAKNKDIQAIYG